MWIPVAGAFLLSVGSAGCGTPTPPDAEPSSHAVGAYDPAWITHRPELPAPDTDRINYDVRTRTLTLYELSGNERWLLLLPGETDPRPVPPQLRLPDVDISETYIYYTRPGRKLSTPVTVRQILESGNAHVSIADRK
jgi:hypothetical protein